MQMVQKTLDMQQIRYILQILPARIVLRGTVTCRRTGRLVRPLVRSDDADRHTACFWKYASAARTVPGPCFDLRIRFGQRLQSRFAARDLRWDVHPVRHTVAVRVLGHPHQLLHFFMQLRCDPANVPMRQRAVLARIRLDLDTIQLNPAQFDQLRLLRNPSGAVRSGSHRADGSVGTEPGVCGPRDGGASALGLPATSPPPTVATDNRSDDQLARSDSSMGALSELLDSLTPNMPDG